MPVVFVSYSRQDSQFVLRLVNDLKKKSLSVWLDQTDIVPGVHWDLAVQRALEAATHVLFVMSSASIISENVLDEINFALNEHKQIIPLLIADCKPPFRVDRMQRIDFRSDYEMGLGQVLSVLGQSDKGVSSEQDILEEPKWVKGLLTSQSTSVSDIHDENDVKLITGRHILIVEDTLELAEVLQATSERMGIPAFHAADGRKAIAFIKKNRPDLLLLDIGLGDMVGWSVLEQLKEVYTDNFPPVVIISSYGDPTNRLLGRLQKVEDYLVKPFTPEEVELVIRKVLKLPEK